MRNLATWLVYIALSAVAVIVLLFAVANRAWVTLSLDPFNPGAPALTFSAPLFIVLFGSLLVGVAIGGGVCWLRQGRHRRGQRAARADAARYLAELETMRAHQRGEPEPQIPVIAPF